MNINGVEKCHEDPLICLPLSLPKKRTRDDSFLLDSYEEDGLGNKFEWSDLIEKNEHQIVKFSDIFAFWQRRKLTEWKKILLRNGFYC